MMCSIVKVQGERGGRKDAADLSPCHNGGQKSNGRGVQLHIPLSFVHRVSPSPYIYAVVSGRVALGERPFPAPPQGPYRKRKKRCRA